MVAGNLQHSEYVLAWYEPTKIETIFEAGSWQLSRERISHVLPTWSNAWSSISESWGTCLQRKFHPQPRETAKTSGSLQSPCHHRCRSQLMKHRPQQSWRHDPLSPLAFCWAHQVPVTWPERHQWHQTSFCVFLPTKLVKMFVESAFDSQILVCHVVT